MYRVQGLGSLGPNVGIMYGHGEESRSLTYIFALEAATYRSVPLQCGTGQTATHLKNNQPNLRLDRQSV